MQSENFENEIVITEDTELDEETKRILAKIPKNQLRKIMQPYKPQMSEKQKERNDKLVALNKVKWDKLREDRLKHEEQQLRILSKQVKVKPKRNYIKNPIVYVSDASEEDEQDIEEYKQYRKWKDSKKSKPKPKQISDDDEDEYIQKTKPKIKKATEILNTVNKLDNALKSLNVSNPYFEAMNRKR